MPLIYCSKTLHQFHFQFHRFIKFRFPIRLPYQQLITMAEAALLAILTGFVANVASEPLKKIRLPLWFETELRKLEDTISLIERVVLDAEKKQDTNDQARVWLDSLEDVIYDADNLVNKVFYKKLQDEVVPGKIKAKVRNLNPHFRWKISNKITQIRETLADIKGNRDFLLRLGRLEVGGVSASTEGWGETDSYLSSDQVIGRVADREDVLRHLLDNNIEGGENVSVVSIVGFGGLGKTTLAKFVFNDTRVKEYFVNKTYWVSVSIFDLKLLLQKIIRSVTGTSPEPNLDREQLQNLLRGKIQGEKYLLVLDNVWNEDIGQWDSLKTFLNVGAEGSKVLITTRSEIVARMTTHSTRIYSLGRLDENRSWALFEREAFVQQSYEPTVYPRLVKIGKEIVAKCQGVPLAIKAIGTLLKSRQYTSQNVESEWKSFRDTKLAEVDFEDQSKNMMAILKLS